MTTADAVDIDRENLAQARDLIAVGVPVFIARPNPNYDPSDTKSREFFLPDAWQETAPDVSVLNAWTPGDALCLVAGHGVDVVDVDTKNGANPAEHLARLEGVGVDVLAIVRTPSAGIHAYVRSVGLCSAGSQTVGVDYRGRGLDGSGSGFLYMPGTQRPKYDGGGYEWEKLPDVYDIAETTDADREEQRDAVATYLAGIGYSPRTHRTDRDVQEIGGEEVNLSAIPPWLSADLEDLGPTWEKKNGTKHRDRSERFHNLVHACKRAGLTPGQTVTLLDPWCSALGKYVGRVDLEVSRSLSKDDTEPTRAPALSVVSDSYAPDDSAPWDPPVPIGGDSITADPVTLDGLPWLVREMVRAQATESAAPQEIALGAVLGALSAATRGVWDIHVSSSWYAGPSVLWTLTLAESGERKSGAVRPLIEPLRALERHAATEVLKENRLRAGRREIATAALKAEQKTSETKPEPDVEKVDRLTDEVHANRDRPRPALVQTDTTTEALGMHMTKQGGAVAMFTTEATAFQSVAGSYKKDGTSNVGLLNSAWDAEEYRDLRVSRAGMDVSRPVLVWCAAVQPAVLAGYATSGTEGSGFLARFLMFSPNSLQGLRTMRTEPVSLALRAEWSETLRRIHSHAWRHYAAMTDDLPDEMGEPLRLDFEPDAADALYSHAQELEDRNTPTSDLRTLGGWVGKLPAQLARIAAVLALAEDPTRTTVPREYVENALSLSDSLIRHALATFAVMRKSDQEDPARRVIAALRKLRAPDVSTRQVHKEIQGQAWVRGAESVREALEDLADLGYVRPVTVKTGGRPSERWLVHPDLLG